MRLIDADAFIQMMEEKCDPESTLDPWVLSVCRGGVKMMPIVDAVPVVHGHWVKKRYWSDGVGMGESYGYLYACSECGHEVKGDYNSCGDKFCSKCGALMDGKGNSNEAD